MSILRHKQKLLPQSGPMGGGGGKGGGGGGPSGGGSTQQANQYSNISPWASPYVSSILGAAQNQVFKTQTTPGTAAHWVDSAGNPVSTDLATAANQNAQNSAGVDANGNPIGGTNPYTFVDATPASSEITGMNPYNAYGYQGSGMTADDMAAAQASVAGFTPLQQQAFQGASNLQLPSQYGQATNLATQAGQGALGTTNQAGMYGQQGSMAGQRGANLSNMYGQQGTAIGQSLGQQSQSTAQGPGSVSSYMNPYLQASLNPQLQLSNQQYGIQSAAQQGAATQAGAFGGSRNALQQSLTQQNQMLANNQLIGQGYNTAFNNAQAQMNAANQAALAGNQQALSGANQAGQLGIAGAQAGLQGVNAQQAGYGLAGTQGINLANIGAQQLAGQQGILGVKNQYGTQQQQQQQNVINQAMQNYATGQQYPMTQLQQLAALGAPYVTKDVTTTQQQATPSAISQLAGLGTAGIAGLGMYNVMKKP